jgi:hypothetical protein
MKLLVNHCSHGFTLSERQKTLFPELQTVPYMKVSDVNRADERLIASFEAGDNRGDGGSTLAIVEIPDGARFRIISRDGYEEVVWTMGELHSA